MRYFVQIGREFATAGHLVFWKPYPHVSHYSKEYAKCNLGEFFHNNTFI